jgi:NAD(P)-dependent dehydrogenase (short-subunit alcohol dehydrogenase family)
VNTILHQAEIAAGIVFLASPGTSRIIGTVLYVASHSSINISLNTYKLKKYQRESKQIMKKLEGKVAVITGGNSGIGLATAQRFVAEEGAYVFITGRRQSELDAAVKQIGKNITGVQGDVSNLADLDRLYAKVKEQRGRIDILFANAGVAEFARLGEISEAHFDKTFGINVKGLLFSVQKALPLFQDGGGGSIILNASIAASKGFETSTVYSATKAAIRSFARTWTDELKHRKIRVNAISPGYIDTPIFNSAVQSEEQIEQIKTSLVASVPMGRMGSSDEIAKAVSFLASDDSSYVTGIELFVDGGMAQI